MRMPRITVAAPALWLLLAACGDGETGPTITLPLTATPTTTIPTEPTSSTRPTQEDIMRLTSMAFAEGKTIPAEYTCDGEDVSPPLRIEGIPEGTQTLVLIMDDPDAPGGTWDHWVVFGIEPTAEIPRAVEGIGTDGVTSLGTTGYGGPCPPSDSHRYVHQVYALDSPSTYPRGRPNRRCWRRWRATFWLRPHSPVATGDFAREGWLTVLVTSGLSLMERPLVVAT